MLPKNQHERLEKYLKWLDALHGDMLFGDMSAPEDYDDPDMDDMPPLAVQEYITALHFIDLAHNALKKTVIHLPDETG